ncbi:MalY/PatB family protein [Flammeovirga sp. SJP92]|uniref:MalY/PatB family protein n=1 Tax=Flammeovirga sp. SJP92 TaxID=1775430 RepID=UPI000788947C|nr:PatB family C-S lyase [Flammeovirga sp. SJP92]KXX67384.1 hypothetical protein AVL50_27190 [Flammeovirga sp. SJP92]
MNYDFNKIYDREGTYSVKYGLREKLFGTEDIIPLWVADMDLAVAPEIVEALQKRVSHPIYGYTMQTDVFWQSAQNWIKKRHQWEVNSSELVFAPGIVPALGFLVQAFSEVNDKVGIFTPVYPPFYENVQKNNRELVQFSLQNKNGRYFIDFDKVEDAMKDGLKLIVFCNPHNPSGRMWKKEELTQLLALCEKYDVNIISDEIHADLTLWGNKHVPFASISEIAAKRVITCMAPSKTFNLAGLNCAYLIFKNEKLKSKYLKLVQHLHFDFGGTFATESMLAAYTKGEQWYKALLQHIEKNISFVEEKLASTPIHVMHPDATYLLWLDCKAFEPSGTLLKKFFYEKCKVGVQDGRQFGVDGVGFMRLNTATPFPILEKAVNRILESL